MKLKYCLIVLIISSFLASIVQTNFGKVDITLERLDTENSQYIYYDLYKPKTATAENKAPFIAIIPGFQRSKEALSNIAIELSRRGYVVGLIDPYAQGLSSSSLSRRAATTEGYGMFALIDHIYESDQYEYINKELLGTTGHSMGGNAAIRGANYFGKRAKRTNEPSRLHSVYVSGYVLTLTDNVLKDVKSNVGVSYALYDEGAFRNDLKGWEAADMTIAPESLRTVNSILRLENIVSKVELGKYYGDLQNNTLRVIFNEKLLHPFQPYNAEATANQLSYFDYVFTEPIPLDNYNQIWQWKELFTLINMIVGFLLIIPLTRHLLQIKFFSSIVKPVPPALPKQSQQGKIVFWSVFVIGATIACITFIPMVDIAKVLFPEAANRELTWFFPQRMNNSVMLWAVLNGSVGFILFFLSYFLFGKKHGVTMSSWGANVNFSDLAKTFLLGILVFLIYYIILYSIYYLFHIDYRFWFMGVRISYFSFLIH